MVQVLNVNALRYPVIIFSQETFVVKTTTEGITVWPSSYLKRPWFRGMIIVDAQGLAFLVDNAYKTTSAGWKWIGPLPIKFSRVELQYRQEPFYMSVEEVKVHILKCSSSWHQLEAGGTDTLVRDQLERAQSIIELIEICFYDDME